MTLLIVIPKSRWATDCWSKSGMAHLFEPIPGKRGEFKSACGHRRARKEDLQPEDALMRCDRCQNIENRSR